MKTFARIIALGGLAMSTLGVVAQTANSGYFLENYTYRFQMNPAMNNEKGFVSMPGLGNLYIGARGNLHLKDVIYNIDGRSCLFTNPLISDAEAMSGFSDKNRLGASVRENIFSVGFKGFKGYNTISISARTDVNVTLPKALFSLAKEGVANKTYDITDVGVNGAAYAEVAFNHSHNLYKLVPGLSVGATVKALVPFAAVDARFHKAQLTLGHDGWIGLTDADVYVSAPNFQYEKKLNDQGQEYVSGLNFDGDEGFSTQGFGMAVDLGATYYWRGFTFSAAVLDLGWMSLNKAHVATTGGEQRVNTDAFTFNADGDAPNSFSNEWDRLADDFEKLYQLRSDGSTVKRNHSLATTLNLGVPYDLPVYDRLQFGLLSSTRMAGRYSWTEARLSANVNPVNCFSANVNVAAGTFGTSFGWMANLSVTGFNFFIGMDHVPGKLSKQYAPLSSNVSLNLGMNFMF